MRHHFVINVAGSGNRWYVGTLSEGFEALEGKFSSDGVEQAHTYLSAFLSTNRAWLSLYFSRSDHDVLLAYGNYFGDDARDTSGRSIQFFHCARLDHPGDLPHGVCAVLAKYSTASAKRFASDIHDVASKGDEPTQLLQRIATDIESQFEASKLSWSPPLPNDAARSGGVEHDWFGALVPSWLNLALQQTASPPPWIVRDEVLEGRRYMTRVVDSGQPPRRASEILKSVHALSQDARPLPSLKGSKLAASAARVIAESAPSDPFANIETQRPAEKPSYTLPPIAPPPTRPSVPAPPSSPPAQDLRRLWFVSGFLTLLTGVGGYFLGSLTATPRPSLFTTSDASTSTQVGLADVNNAPAPDVSTAPLETGAHPITVPSPPDAATPPDSAPDVTPDAHYDAEAGDASVSPVVTPRQQNPGTPHRPRPHAPRDASSSNTVPPPDANTPTAPSRGDAATIAPHDDTSARPQTSGGSAPPPATPLPPQPTTPSNAPPVVHPTSRPPGPPFGAAPVGPNPAPSGGPAPAASPVHPPTASGPAPVAGHPAPSANVPSAPAARDADSPGRGDAVHR